MFTVSNEEIRVIDGVDLLESCDLDCDHVVHGVSRLAAFNVDEMKPEAFVANDTIVSIVAGMSKDNKQIIKDSMLFASLGASSKYPNGGIAWYGLYLQLLMLTGWTPQTKGMSDLRMGNTRFTMDKVALKILESAILAAAVPGSTALMLLSVAKDTVSALQENDEPLRLFERSTKTHSGAKFAVASTAESADGEVFMALGALDFNTSLSVTNVLFWEWSSSSVSIQRAENHMTLNQVHYNERAREIVERRLTEVARRALLEFDF